MTHPEQPNGRYEDVNVVWTSSYNTMYLQNQKDLLSWEPSYIVLFIHHIVLNYTYHNNMHQLHYSRYVKKKKLDLWKFINQYIVKQFPIQIPLTH